MMALEKKSEESHLLGTMNVQDYMATHLIKDICYVQILLKAFSIFFALHYCKSM